MATRKVKAPVIIEEEIIKEEPAVEEIKEVKEKSKKVVKGKVFNCTGLNVRKSPSTESEIVTVYSAGTEIIIEECEKPDWYKTPSGYVMKAYIQK